MAVTGVLQARGLAGRREPRLARFFQTQPPAGPGISSPQRAKGCFRGGGGPGRAGQWGRKTREGGRLERKRRCPEAAMAEGRGSRFSAASPRFPPPPPRFPPPPFHNFPPPRTLGLPRRRRVPDVSPPRPPRRGPHLRATIRGPSGRACALAPRRRPRPARPRPLRGGHDDSGPAGRGRRVPPLRASRRSEPSVSHLPAPVTPGGFPPHCPVLGPLPRLHSAPGAAVSGAGSRLSATRRHLITEPPGCARLRSRGCPAASLHRSPSSTFPAVWRQPLSTGPGAQHIFSEWRETPSRGFCGQGLPPASCV